MSTYRSFSRREKLQEILTPTTNEFNDNHFDTLINLVPRHGGEHNDYINYGHWISEDLPRLRAYDQYCANTNRDPTLLIKKEPPSWMINTLQLLGFSPSDWTEWDRDVATVSRLIVPKLNYVHSVGSSFNPSDRAWVSEEMKSRIDLSESDEFPDCIFISRQGQPRRKIINFDEVMNVLSPLGFEAVRPEELSIEDQVRIFNQAKVIVGPSGSGLANIIFAENASLVEIKPHGFEVTVWHILTSERGLQYDYIRGDSSNADSTNSDRNANIHVDAQNLYDSVSNLI
jgi:capsular polysaccharide biosynthesis protein